MSGVEKLVCSMEWDHIEAVAEGGEDASNNLHLISTGLNATIGDANTREWALAHGHGVLKIPPPSATELAASLRTPWWNGHEATNSETAPRLARAHIEVLVPWDGVLEAIKRKARRTGQSVLDFRRSDIPAERDEPAVAVAAAVDVTCHRTRCNLVVKDATGAPLVGVGMPAGKSIYCVPHAETHLTHLRSVRESRLRRRTASSQSVV